MGRPETRRVHSTGSRQSTRGQLFHQAQNEREYDELSWITQVHVSHYILSNSRQPRASRAPTKQTRRPQTRPAPPSPALRYAASNLEASFLYHTLNRPAALRGTWQLQTLQDPHAFFFFKPLHVAHGPTTRRDGTWEERRGYSYTRVVPVADEFLTIIANGQLLGSSPWPARRRSAACRPRGRSSFPFPGNRDDFTEVTKGGARRSRASRRIAHAREIRAPPPSMPQISSQEAGGD